MTRTKVLKWYSEKFPFLFALLIPCHCHSNFNPFEDFISHTHELHLFYAWKRIECVQKEIASMMNLWILKWVKVVVRIWNNHLSCALKCLWGNENRRVCIKFVDTQIKSVNMLCTFSSVLCFRLLDAQTHAPALVSALVCTIHPIWNICRRMHRGKNALCTRRNDAHISEMRSNAMVRYRFNQCAFVYRTRCDTCSFATSACTNVWLLIDLFGFGFALLCFLHKAVRFPGQKMRSRKNRDAAKERRSIYSVSIWYAYASHSHSKKILRKQDTWLPGVEVPCSVLSIFHSSLQYNCCFFAVAAAAATVKQQNKTTWT